MGKSVKTIALITDMLSGMGSYQEDIWHGVVKSVKNLGHNLMVFPGGSIDVRPTNKYEYNRNIIYDVIDEHNIDGIVLAGGTIGNYIRHERFEEFVGRYKHIPMVCIAAGLAGIPNIMIDNETGFEKLIEHLIVEHHYRELAYISGPEASNDSVKRFQAYKKILAKFDIPFNDKLYFLGTFDEPSGHEAIRVWLDERKVSFRAVVAANDNMAIGALKELELRGISVPHKVAVVGFDDVVEANIVTPALTTIRQPVALQVEKAVELLSQIMEGRYPDEQMIYIDTEMVVRKSCGCTGMSQEEGERIEIKVEASRQDWLDSVSHTIAQYCSDESDTIVIKRLFLTFLDELQEKTKDVFLGEWEAFVNNHLDKTEDLLIINKCLATFHEAGLSFDKSRQMAAENIIYRARNVLMEIIQRLEAKKRTQAESLSHKISMIGMMLGVSFDIVELSEIIAQVMPTLNIENFMFGLYKDPFKPLEQVSIICRYRNGERLDLGEGELILPAGEIVNMDFLRDHEQMCYVVYPLYFKEEQLGLFIMELAPEYGFVYETIYSQICTSIEGALLVERNLQVRRVIEKHSRDIENLTLPMIESIKHISGIANDKMQVVNTLADQTKQSWESLNETNKNIERIAANINKLLDIIKIIEDIADRVNLLALNTSIEAAHVGQYGVGFAVIAKEIKKLSETTRMHSNEISGTLKEIVKYAQDTSHYGQRSIETFQSQQQGVHDILSSFEIISEKMRELGQSSSTILNMIQKK
jgi:DNA-binding LacI/PurR family transcriptional regulator